MAGALQDIPDRARTLAVLRQMGEFSVILMLPGDGSGYGCRWTLQGEQVEPSIASYLMSSGCIAETGRTEFGARTLALTAQGRAFRDEGLRWWSALGWLEKLRVMLFG